MYLSSCPGKKVRLTGPIIPGGRSGISRDLKLDLLRIKNQYSIETIICCLNDAELDFLGAPWREYELASLELGIKIVRIPLLEGFAPDDILIFDQLLADLVSNVTLKGGNVLCHCRGGVGRAGLLAVCWLIKMGLLGPLPDKDGDNVMQEAMEMLELAIMVIRKRRSTKAIETPLQVRFILQYILFLAQFGQYASASSLLSSP